MVSTVLGGWRAESGAAVVECCCIQIDEPAEFYHRQDVKRARKPRNCCECGREIPKGAPYCYETAVFNNVWNAYHTCQLCVSIRDDRFSCGWEWGFLWENLHYCLDDQLGCDCEDDCDCDSWLDPPTHPILPGRGRL